MAIAPIDLQTIFTQVDKVGKAQTAQREGQEIQQALHGVKLERKTEEHIQQVNEAQDTGEGVEKINDRTHQKKNDKKNNETFSENTEDSNEEDQPQIVLRDPYLGNKIDISY